MTHGNPRYAASQILRISSPGAPAPDYIETLVVSDDESGNLTNTVVLAES